MSESTTSRRIPWWMKTIIGLVVVLFLAVAAFSLWAWSVNRGWENYAAMLRAKGEPLTFEEIEALRTKVPEDENGARVIETVQDELIALADAEVDPRVLVFGKEGPGQGIKEGLKPESIEASRAFLAQHHDLLETIHRIDEFESGRFDVSFPSNPLEIELEHVKALRTAGRLIRVESILDPIDGDLNSAGRAVDRMLRLADLIGDEPFFLSHLVKVSSHALAVVMLGETLKAGEMDDAMLAALGNRFDKSLAQSTLQWALWGERASFIAICESFSAEELSFIIRMNQRKGSELLTAIIDARDDYPRAFAATAAVRRTVEELSFLYTPISIYLPNLERAVILSAISDGELRCAQVAIAAERYRLATGRLPEASSDLVPAYLDDWPVDPLDHQPIRMIPSERGIIIYHVSENMIDDGGMIEPIEGKRRGRDEGIELLHPEFRGIVIFDDAPFE